MKTDLQQLEAELLALEEQFSGNETVELRSFVKKTKQYTALKVEEAKKNSFASGYESGLDEGLKEGLDAGLVLQKLKKTHLERFEQSQESNKSNKTNESGEKIHDQSVKTEISKPIIAKEANDKEDLPVYIETASSPQEEVRKEGEKPKYVRVNDRVQIPPQEPLLSKIKSQAVEKIQEHAPYTTDFSPLQNKLTELSEVNLGKYVMGVLAAILTLTGVVLLGSMMWGQISAVGKTAILLFVATPMIVLPFRSVSAENTKIKNGFLTSLMGTGLSVYFVTALLMNLFWGLIGESTLLFTLIGLIFLTVFLSYKIQSNTLMVVAFVGNFTTIMLLTLKILPVARIYFALPPLLATTLFLLVFSLKKEWIYGLTKILAVAESLVVTILSHTIITNTYQSLVLGPEIPHYTEMGSSLFGIFWGVAGFALLIALIIGKVACSAEDIDLEGTWTGQGEVIHVVILALTYFLFTASFSVVPWFALLIIASTFVFNHEKATPTLVSLAFVPFLVSEFVGDLADQHNNVNMTTSRFPEPFVNCMIFVGIAFLIHFTTKWLESNRCNVALGGYSGLAFLIALADFEHLLEFTPVIVLFSLHFYTGYRNSQDGDVGPITQTKLLSFVPIGILLAKVIGEINDEYFFVFVPSVVLLMAGLLSLMELYQQKLQDCKGFLLLLQIIKIGASGLSCFFINFEGGPFAFYALSAVALLSNMIELIFRLRGEEDAKKPFYMICLVIGFVSLSQPTPLGAFAITSSVIILFMGGCSIFLGFKEQEKRLRELGLGMAILAVLKMVIFDVSNTDSVVRVVALILGAVLCFVISCVYNKLDE